MGDPRIQNFDDADNDDKQSSKNEEDKEKPSKPLEPPFIITKVAKKDRPVRTLQKPNVLPSKAFKPVVKRIVPTSIIQKPQKVDSKENKEMKESISNPFIDSHNLLTMQNQLLQNTNLNAMLTQILLSTNPLLENLGALSQMDQSHQFMKNLVLNLLGNNTLAAQQNFPTSLNTIASSINNNTEKCKVHNRSYLNDCGSANFSSAINLV